MITEVYPNIYRIKIPLPGSPLKNLNSYLVRGQDEHLLIDTGFHLPECRAVMLRALKELNVQPNDLDVFATHIHTDHIGLAPELIGSNRHIYLGQDDHIFISSQETQHYWDIMDERFLMEGFPKNELAELVDTNPARSLGPALDLPSYQLVVPGKKFYIGNYTLEAIAAPGHTPGQLCLWIAREGVMFTADHVLFDITPNIAMWPNMPDALGSYLDSLGKFKNFEVTLALPGHRETGDYYARIDALLAHHNHRIAETKQIVQSHPGLLAYEIAGLMTWKIKADTWDQFPLIQKWFAVGECLSHLDYLRQRGEIIRLTNGNVHRYLPASHPQKLS